MSDVAVVEQINALIKCDRPFALYRLPNEQEPYLVLQADNNLEVAHSWDELENMRGFMIAPFALSEKHPIVVIRPDYEVAGIDAIVDTLNSLFSSDPELGAAFNNSYTPIDVEGVIDSSQDLEGAYTSYNNAFMSFMNALKAHRFDKLVLARADSVELSPGFLPFMSFLLACDLYPNMMVSLCHSPATGTYLGSTPEMLLSGEQGTWHTVALAGTMFLQDPRSTRARRYSQVQYDEKDAQLAEAGWCKHLPTIDEWSDKNREEQAIVANYIRDILQGFGVKIIESDPFTAQAGKVVHIKTEFSFKLKENARLSSLIEALHPTPAVCGMPKQDAYGFIQETEPVDRAYYSGIIGPLDKSGITNIFVNLRCMRLDLANNRAILFAGGGILTKSQAQSEFEETQQKMNTMRSLL